MTNEETIQVLKLSAERYMQAAEKIFEPLERERLQKSTTTSNIATKFIGVERISDDDSNNII